MDNALYTIFNPNIWVPIIIVRQLVYWVLKVRIEVALGYILFGLWISAENAMFFIYSSILYTFGSSKEKVAKIAYPSNPLDINQTYRLALSEVSLGSDDSGEPIRVDLEKAHTLVVGVTGSGKTIELQSIMLQLFQRGRRFFDTYETYVFDLKGDDADNIWKWKPLVDNYYSITEGGLEDAVSKLEQLARSAHDKNRKRRIAVFVDEMAMFTQQSANKELRIRGEAAFLTLTSQIRSKGFLVGATQRPHYESVPRNVSSQFERKICFRVEAQQDAEQLAFRGRKLDWFFQSFESGEFVVKEPGRRELYRHGQTRMVNPAHIDAVVIAVSGNLDGDVRVQVLKQAITGVGVGKSVIGANRIAPHVEVTNNKVAEFYRSFAMLGIFEQKLNVNGGVSYSKLAVNPTEAVRILEEAIRTGSYPNGI